MEKTALQQAIELVEKEADQTTELMSGNLKILADSLRELLPVEREQMWEAFNEGNKITYLSLSDFVSFDDYFTKTYTQE
jgi:hypothetical protein